LNLTTWVVTAKCILYKEKNKREKQETVEIMQLIVNGHALPDGAGKRK
jgi:hypothetical protein